MTEASDDRSPTPSPALSPALSLDEHDDDRRITPRIDPTLAEHHAAPWWLLLLRITLTLGTLLLAPDDAPVVMAMAAAAAWLLGGWLLRYPVTLAPGRALFVGGLRHTTQPGRHWLRKRWRDTPHSISTASLRVRWQPAPTRVHHQGHDDHRWLELSLDIWVRPADDEAGLFTALMLYEAWQCFPEALGRDLRRHILPVAVAAFEPSVDWAAAQADEGVDVAPAIAGVLDEATRRLGWRLLHRAELCARLLGRTDDLQTEDRLSIRQTDPPAPSDRADPSPSATP